MRAKKQGKFTLLFILMLLSVFTFNTSPVFAQEEDFEEEIVEDEEFLDEEEEFLEDEEEFLDEEMEADDLYANEEGIDDPTGMYKLDDITAETFQKISNIERENALMKLRIEQGKLKLDLQKQAAEKKKIEANALEDERQREIKKEEQERKLAQARRKEQEELDKDLAEKKKKQQEEELQKKLMEKINSADLSNPDDVASLTQLMTLATGKSVSDLGKGNMKEKEEVPFDEKYTVKSIMGAAGNLVANVENTVKKSTFKVRAGSVIDGWFVEDVKGTSVLLKKDGQMKVMNLN